MIKKDVWGWAGIIAGSVALMLALIHFMAGPFSPPSSLEGLIAAKAVAIKHATIAALQGKEVISPPLREAWNVDRILSTVIAVFAAGAIILGALGGLARKEDHQVAIAAVLLGVATIALQFAIMVLCVILLVILIAGVIGALVG